MGARMGVVGLAVMGENLALNIASRGFEVAVFNRTAARTEEFLAGRAHGQPIVGAAELADFVALLERPRAILLMIRAGAAVDDTIGKLAPLLDEGDILIDGGNSHFADTQRRVRELSDRGLLYVGTGVSGGEEGALTGPSIMPGGAPDAWPRIEDVFEAIAARAPDGAPCVAWLGPDGAGHFVKMVHNGIEYGDMQMIAEAYHLLREVGGLTNAQAADAFADWNDGPLDSFLIEITTTILRTKDPETGGDLIDVIADAAGQKGTGKWTSVTALDLGSPAATIAEAVFARVLSSRVDERAQMEAVFAGPEATLEVDARAFAADVRDALHASKICSYAQGFQLLRLASDEYGFGLDYATIADIWRAGCIIRARLLSDIAGAFRRDADGSSLLLDAAFAETMRGLLPGWRRTVERAARHGAWTPAMASALSYFDGSRRGHLPTSLVQAQRDYFGAHTYERTDRPGERFHTDWTGHGGQTASTSYTV